MFLFWIVECTLVGILLIAAIIAGMRGVILCVEKVCGWASKFGWVKFIGTSIGYLVVGSLLIGVLVMAHDVGCHLQGHHHEWLMKDDNHTK